MDPKAGVKKIGQELKEEFDKAGMGSVEAFGDKLEGIQQMAKEGPSAIIDVLKNAMEGMEAKMAEIMNNPASLAPSGGMAACADWYGSSVAGKLTAMANQTKDMKDTVLKMGEPMKKLADTLEDSMKQLEASLKRLSKLPAEVMKLGDTVDSPDDVAKIDTGSMKKCTDTSPIEDILKKVAGLKDILGPAVEAVKGAIKSLSDFISAAPDMIKNAFDVPQPFCFMTAVLLSQAPQPMKDLLKMVDGLKAVELEPVVQMLGDAMETITNIDIDALKAPVEKFGSVAAEKVDALDKVVKGAKAAGGLSAIKSPF